MQKTHVRPNHSQPIALNTMWRKVSFHSTMTDTLFVNNEGKKHVFMKLISNMHSKRIYGKTNAWKKMVEISYKNCMHNSGAKYLHSKVAELYPISLALFLPIIFHDLFHFSLSLFGSFPVSRETREKRF